MKDFNVTAEKIGNALAIFGLKVKHIQAHKWNEARITAVVGKNKITIHYRAEYGLAKIYVSGAEEFKYCDDAVKFYGAVGKLMDYTAWWQMDKLAAELADCAMAAGKSLIRNYE